MGVVGLAVLVVPAVAQAQTAPTQHTFTTVDAVEVTGSTLSITGIQGGDSAPTTVTILVRYVGEDQVFLATCERKALLVMAKPGQYVFSYREPEYAYAPPTCALARVKP